MVLDFNQVLTYILAAVGIAGFLLAGKKIWWAWYVNIANQVLWTVYSIVSQQPAFLIATAVYFVVFIKNAHVWTKEHFAKTTEEEVLFDVSGVQGDPEAMTRFMRVEGTDPAVSNEIAFVVTDVVQANHGTDYWVDFSERYSIAHEVQRRLDVKLKGTRPDVRRNIDEGIDIIDTLTENSIKHEDDRVNYRSVPEVLLSLRNLLTNLKGKV